MKSTFPFFKKSRVISLKAKLTSLCACSSVIFSTAVCFDSSASFFSVERLSCQQKKCLLIQQYYIKWHQFKETFFFLNKTLLPVPVSVHGKRVYPKEFALSLIGAFHLPVPVSVHGKRVYPKEFALSLIGAFQRCYRINHMCYISERSPILRSFELFLGRCRILLDDVRSGFNELKHSGRTQHHLTMLDVVWPTCWQWIRSKLDCMMQSLLDKVN